MFKEYAKLLLTLPHCILRAPAIFEIPGKTLPAEEQSGDTKPPEEHQSEYRLECLSPRHGKKRLHGNRSAYASANVADPVSLMLMAAHAVRLNQQGTDQSQIGFAADGFDRAYFVCP